MPLYDYVCAACGRRFEVIHGVHADPPASCPLCGEGPVRKAITAPTVHYRGSGWAKKERRAAIKTGASTGSGDESASEASSGSDDGSSKESAPSTSEAESSTSVPAATTTGDRPKESAKPSTSGTSAKAHARDSD